MIFLFHCIYFSFTYGFFSFCLSSIFYFLQKPLFESSVSCWFLCWSNVLFGQMIFKDECWTQLRFIVCCCFFTSGDFVLLVFFGGRSIFVCFCGVFFFFKYCFLSCCWFKKKKKILLFIHFYSYLIWVLCSSTRHDL